MFLSMSSLKRILRRRRGRSYIPSYSYNNPTGVDDATILTKYKRPLVIQQSHQYTIMSDYIPSLDKAMSGLLPCAAGDFCQAHASHQDVRNSPHHHHCSNCLKKVHCLLLCGRTYDKIAPLVSRSDFSLELQEKVQHNPRYSGIVCFDCIHPISMQLGEEMIFQLLPHSPPPERASSPTSAGEQGEKIDATLNMGTVHVPCQKDDIESYGDDEFPAMKSNDPLPPVLASNPSMKNDQKLKHRAAKSAMTKKNNEEQIWAAMTWSLDDVKTPEDNSTVLHIGGIQQRRS